MRLREACQGGGATPAPGVGFLSRATAVAGTLQGLGPPSAPRSPPHIFDSAQCIKLLFHVIILKPKVCPCPRIGPSATSVLQSTSVPRTRSVKMTRADLWGLATRCQPRRTPSPLFTAQTHNVTLHGVCPFEILSLRGELFQDLSLRTVLVFTVHLSSPAPNSVFVS